MRLTRKRLREEESEDDEDDYKPAKQDTSRQREYVNKSIMKKSSYEAKSERLTKDIELKNPKAKNKSKKNEIVIIDSSDDEEDEVEWIDDDTKVIWRGNVISVGSNVIVKVEGSQSQFAIIESLWRTKSGENMAEFRWYYEFNDLPKSIKQKSEQAGSGIAPFLPFELLETDHVDENPIESIEQVVENIIFLSNTNDYREKNEDFMKSSQKRKQGSKVDPKLNNLYFYNRLYSILTGILRSSIPHRPGIYSNRSRSTIKNNDLNKNKNPDSFESQILTACNQLHLSSVPDELPCREEERNKIRCFLEGALKNNLNKVLYISGMPGTGKTATVNEVVRTLRKDSNIPNFKYIEVNGMKLSTPQHCYSVLLKSITGLDCSPNESLKRLESYFSFQREQNEWIVLLIDEMDYLVTRSQAIIYNLFDWPFRARADLVVIGIANTMDLPERLLPRIQSRIGIERVPFRPYTREQIGIIIETRLGALTNVFGNSGLDLCSRKVASLSGDIRRALQICKRAAEICLRRYQDSEDKTKKFLVGIEHVTQAEKELSSSLYVRAIASASLYEQLFLISVLKVTSHMQTEEVLLSSVYEKFVEILRGLTISSSDGTNNINFDILTKFEAQQICERLGQMKLIIHSYENNRRDIPVRLGVLPDDIMFALQNHQDLGKLL